MMAQLFSRSLNKRHSQGSRQKKPSALRRVLAVELAVPWPSVTDRAWQTGEVREAGHIDVSASCGGLLPNLRVWATPSTSWDLRCVGCWNCWLLQPSLSLFKSQSSHLEIGLGMLDSIIIQKMKCVPSVVLSFLPIRHKKGRRDGDWRPQRACFPVPGNSRKNS